MGKRMSSGKVGFEIAVREIFGQWQRKPERNKRCPKLDYGGSLVTVLAARV